MPLASTTIRSPLKPSPTARPLSPTEDWNCGVEQAGDRRLSTTDGSHLRPAPAPRTALRRARHRFGVALRPPVRAGRTRLPLAGSLDAGDGVAQPHGAHPGRTHGV